MFANNLKSAFFTVSTKIFIEETHKNSHLYGLQQTFHKSKKANYCEVFPASNYLGIFLPHWIATKKGYSPAHSICKHILRKNAAKPTPK